MVCLCICPHPCRYRISRRRTKAATEAPAAIAFVGDDASAPGAAPSPADKLRACDLHANQLHMVELTLARLHEVILSGADELL